ncbi:MAG: FG-GAP repeat domain-containing protein, partial [Myxococcales bacterium]
MRPARRLLSCALAALLATGCAEKPDPGPAPDPKEEPNPLPEPKCTAGTLWKPGRRMFADVTAKSGLAALKVTGSRLNVVDFDHDGWPDLVVRRVGNPADANDAANNRYTWLLRNNRDGTFADVTEASGFAQTRSPQATPLLRPGEVVAFADVDNDGDLDGYTGLSTGNPARAFGETLPGQIARAREAIKNIFGDLVNLIASPLARALGALNAFLGDLAAARTVQARIDIVWQGAREATASAQDLLGQAVAQIDFGAVWEQARGIADGLQRRLEQVDFAFIGREVGDGIADAVRVAIPAAKDFTSRINNALRQIDFVAAGRALGPGLAAAVVTAFVTLADPAFWVKNWDLALAV